MQRWSIWHTVPSISSRSASLVTSRCIKTCTVTRKSHINDEQPTSLRDGLPGTRSLDSPAPLFFIKGSFFPNPLALLGGDGGNFEILVFLSAIDKGKSECWHGGGGAALGCRLKVRERMYPWV